MIWCTFCDVMPEDQRTWCAACRRTDLHPSFVACWRRHRSAPRRGPASRSLRGISAASRRCRSIAQQCWRRYGRTGSHQLIYEDEGHGRGPGVAGRSDRCQRSFSILVTGESVAQVRKSSPWLLTENRLALEQVAPLLNSARFRKICWNQVLPATKRVRSPKTIARRHQAGCRRGQWRHLAAGRNRRNGCAPAGQVATRNPGA